MIFRFGNEELRNSYLAGQVKALDRVGELGNESRMQMAETVEVAAAGEESFAQLLEETYGTEPNLEGSVIKGTVIAIENDMAVIDIGLKSEGRVPLKEFSTPGQSADLKIGDGVEVYLERIEIPPKNRFSNASLLRKARGIGG